ncbi:hypothetical protein HYFRA_00005466 [Hymenoscyphus fraxineus]|uniref:Uncharacterized protein n=1 Tax=Hymenoscyphus fraxineus TaxID=746836 RepID=A0A9N9PLX8_9HELO|nr:hypothetical protein HYFRA_00005466 [Hymenoscyphus fraxineus]
MSSKLLATFVTLFALASAAPQALPTPTVIAPPPTITFPTSDWITQCQPTVKLAGSPLHGKLINAAEGSFFIGKEPTTTCIDTAPCATFSNKTTIAFSQNNGWGNLSVAAPGGQFVYVLLTGEFEYTAPGASAPSGALITEFIRGEYWLPTGAIYAAITFGGGLWLACPTGEGDVYRVFAAAYATGSGCTAFEMHADETSDQSPQAYAFSV